MKTTAILLSLLALPTVAAADEPDVGVAADVEVDPIAYALDGYSLHVGVGAGDLRFDLGAYALAVPAWVHGNDGFEAAFDGFGAKVQWFPLGERRGLFAGAGPGVARVRIRHTETAMTERDDRFSLGAHVGWRFDLPQHLYITPWIGLDYAFGAEDVMIGGDTYESTPWTIFPTVHVGYRFD